MKTSSELSLKLIKKIKQKLGMALHLSDLVEPAVFKMFVQIWQDQYKAVNKCSKRQLLVEASGIKDCRDQLAQDVVSKAWEDLLN